jgi:uncharacterized protein (TIGR03000 family)
MKVRHIQFLLAALWLAAAADPAWAWGRGGGFRAGGAAVGGYRGGAVGGYRGGAVGGYRAGGAAVGGYRAGAVGVQGGAVGARGVGAVGGYRAGAVGVGGRAGVATDFGFGRVGGVGAGRGVVAVGHRTTAYTGGYIAARGTAVRGNFYHYGAFNTGWWAGRTGAWRPYGWTAANVWRWAAWPAVATWFAWSVPPVYYDFGNTIVYEGDQVYVDSQPVATADEYYQQAADLAYSAPAAPAAPPKDEEWQPLGVFALVQGDQADPSAVFQLAVNKAGTVRGNYYNVLTDNNLPVQGAVDKKSQRASWIVGEQKEVVYDTGIANLTKDESPLLIHFGKDRTQQWLLVRIKDQEDPNAPQVAKRDELPAPPATTGDTTAKITVIVPPEAEVTFDGVVMKQPGPERHFHTPPLQPTAKYSYTIRARWTQDGRPVDQTRTVPFRAGAVLRVDFTSPLP